LILHKVVVELNFGENCLKFRVHLILGNTEILGGNMGFIEGDGVAEFRLLRTMGNLLVALGTLQDIVRQGNELIKSTTTTLENTELRMFITLVLQLSAVCCVALCVLGLFMLLNGVATFALFICSSVFNLVLFLVRPQMILVTCVVGGVMWYLAKPKYQSPLVQQRIPTTPTNYQRKRGIIVVGKAGSGKSSYILAHSQNLLHRDKLGHDPFSETRTVIPVECKRDDLDYVIFLDTPGTGDTQQNEQNTLTNDQIFEQILVASKAFDVVCLVLFIAVEDVLHPRLQSQTYGLITLFQKRFPNWQALVVYGINDVDHILHLPLQKTGMLDISPFLVNAFNRYPRLAQAFTRNRGVLSKIGVNTNNYAVFTSTIESPSSDPVHHDFSQLIAKVNTYATRSNPIFLKNSSYFVVCQRCGKRPENYAIYTSPCTFHGEIVEQGHGKSMKYHTGDYKLLHDGNVAKKCKKTIYDCCKQEITSAGCKHQFNCCLNPEKTSAGCRQRCVDCNKDLLETGCKGKCTSCGKSISSVGCQKKDEHIWLVQNLK
jgi:hypothetical protein